MLNEFLNKIGVPYERLEEEEKKTLFRWLKNLSRQQIGLEDVKNYIRDMADSIAKELCEHELPKKKDIFLKARLRNYLLLLDFLNTPEKAKRSLERYVQNLNL